MIESNARYLVSARIVDTTDEYRLIQILPGFDDAPWQMELFHRVAEPMGREKAAAYVTERYLIDHPGELVRVGRAVITAAVLFALTPEQDWGEVGMYQ